MPVISPQQPFSNSLPRKGPELKSVVVEVYGWRRMIAQKLVFPERESGFISPADLLRGFLRKGYEDGSLMVRYNPATPALVVVSSYRCAWPKV